MIAKRIEPDGEPPPPPITYEPGWLVATITAAMIAGSVINLISGRLFDAAWLAGEAVALIAFVALMPWLIRQMWTFMLRRRRPYDDE